MPHVPEPSPQADAIRKGTFAAFRDRMVELKRSGELLPLHLGDTYLLPPTSALQAVDMEVVIHHQYGPVPGRSDLRRALAEREGIDRNRLWITPGATGGLSTIAGTVFAPGEEVIVLTPSWPLIFGILQSRGVRPVQVDVGPDGWPEGNPAGLRQRLEEAVTERTTGIYFCHPNNPAGFVYPENHLRTLAEFARERRLWVIVDEAYRELVFEPEKQPTAVVPAGLESIPDRLFLVRTFSKTWAMAGHRIGYLIAPEALRSLLFRVATHMTYHASVPGQVMARGALQTSESYVPDLRKTYEEARDETVAALRDHVPFHVAEAGYYLFLDFRERCDTAEEATDLLRKILDRGVSLSPGSAFGKRFDRFARLCYTALPPARHRIALEKIVEVLS